MVTGFIIIHKNSFNDHDHVGQHKDSHNDHDHVGQPSGEREKDHLERPGAAEGDSETKER